MSNRNMGEHLFLWRIVNFSAANQFEFHYLCSPIVRAPDLEDSHWTLEIAPRGEADPDYISLRLCRCSNDGGPSEMHLELEVCLIDVFGTERFKLKTKSTFHKSDILTFPPFVRRIDFYHDKDTLLHNDVLTVQCRAYRSDHMKFPSTRSVLVTKIQVERPTFIWTLDGLEGKASTQKVVHVKSRIFKNGFDFTYKCDTDRDSEQEKRVLRFTIKPKVVNFRIFISAKIQIQDQNPQNQIEAYRFFDYNNTNRWILPDLDISHMMESFRGKDQLKLVCEFAISSGSDIRSTESLIPLIDKFSLEDNSILRDVAFVYKNSINTDITVTANNDDKPFEAHKFILGARSTLFRTVLNEFEQEKKKYFNKTGIDANNPTVPNQICIRRDIVHVFIEHGIDHANIIGIENIVLDQMLNCSYTDEVDIENFYNAMSLYRAGVKFGFFQLRMKSEKYLISHISIKSLDEILVFAHKNNISGLKQECFSFINENRGLFLASDILNSLRQINTDLVNEVLEILKTPESIYW